MIIRALQLFFMAVFFFSCTDGAKDRVDSTTAGEILIVADEAYEPIVQVQVDTFMDFYKYAKIHVKYLPEAEAFNELYNNDSVRIAIVSRTLSQSEDSFFLGKRIIPKSLKVASDAIALIVNRENPDTAITYEMLGAILRGDVKTWKQVAGHSNDSIRIVFDRNGSSNARYLKEKFLAGKNFPPNIYATNSNAAVVDYVNENKNALGVISVNWISDRDDSTAEGFLAKIKVVALSMPDTAGDDKEFYQPYQAYIALKKYPLIRDVYIINREGRSGLGTGFASFMAGDKGQRLIRMMGLLPATMPVRIIQVN